MGKTENILNGALVVKIKPLDTSSASPSSRLTPLCCSNDHTDVLLYFPACVLSIDGILHGQITGKHNGQSWYGR
jgi:hypothetical protein